jgi:hypothetical protein
MKKLILILTAIVIQNSLIAQNDLQQIVDITYNEISIENILTDLSKKYNLSFSFGNVDLTKKESIVYKGKLDEVLKQILTKNNIDYKTINNHIVLKNTSNTTQTVKGRILDIDTRLPLIGVNIIIDNSSPLLGATTDIDGYFKMKNIPIGRYDFTISYLGYETSSLKQINVTSGKEVNLNIQMQEAINDLKAVVISSEEDKTKAQNDMATVSARSFTVEETQRYAGSFSDPARMAQSFAGVACGGDDSESEIIIRGNSSRGLLWRIEGVEVPSPNHFGDMGSGGGAVSMLSSSTLANSDFYTGAFPAEFGNSLSGVFDLKLRNGNSEKREHSFMIGVLGLEASTEGYFSKKSRASYLVNYRYSTLGLLTKIMPNITGIPKYQDLSFKVNVPTKKMGTFSLFGIAGQNDQYEPNEQTDSSLWKSYSDFHDYYQNSKLGIIGLTHKLPISEKSYLTTSLAASGYSFYDLTREYKYENATLKSDTVDESNFKDYNLIGSVTYNYKFNAKHKIRTGVIANQKNYNFDYSSIVDSAWITFFKNKGQSQIYRSFIHWKYRINNDWTLNSGAHFTYLALNQTTSIDPRASLQWQFSQNQSIAISAGVHSKPEHISTYFIDRVLPNGSITYPNKNLKMLKALHFVGAYDITFTENLRLKTEIYYQHLYNIPVSNNVNSAYSILNSQNVFDVIFANDRPGEFLVSEGTARNYGIDITLERFLNNNFYYLITGSLFQSKYRTLSNIEYNTRYANNYVFNLLAGKEFNVGSNKKNILGFNGKIKYLGGNRETPIDLDASILAEQTVHIPNSAYSAQIGDYFRLDFSISYKINKKKSTHSIIIDLQNLTSRLNPSGSYYDNLNKSIVVSKQNGLIPVLNYRIDF